jgi:hypothetical protein
MCDELHECLVQAEIVPDHVFESALAQVTKGPEPSMAGKSWLDISEGTQVSIQSALSCIRVQRALGFECLCTRYLSLKASNCQFAAACFVICAS